MVGPTRSTAVQQVILARLVCQYQEQPGSQEVRRALQEHKIHDPKVLDDLTQQFYVKFAGPRQCKSVSVHGSVAVQSVAYPIVSQNFFPLDQLHQYIIAQVKDESFDTDRWRSFDLTIRLYRSLYPKETFAQVQLARRILQEKMKEVPAIFFKIVSEYVRNPTSLIVWIAPYLERRVTALRTGEAQGSVKKDMVKLFALVRLWSPRLKQNQKRDIARLLQKASNEISGTPNSPIKNFVEEGLYGLMMELLGYAHRGDGKFVSFSKGFFQQNPLSIVDQLLENEGLFEKKMPEADAKALWSFIEVHSTTMAMRPKFWKVVKKLLKIQPSIVPLFIEKREAWARVVESVLRTDLNTVTHDAARELKIHIMNKVHGVWDAIVVNLAYDGKIPEVQVPSTYLALLRKKMSGLDREVYDRFSKTPNFQSFSNAVVLNYLTDDRLNPKQPTRLVWLSHSLLKREVAKIGVLKLHEKYRKILSAEQMKIAMWKLPAFPVTAKYMRDLKEYYLHNHPYGKLLTLPPNLRPTGNVSFVSVDNFHNPFFQAHSDKPQVGVLYYTSKEKWVNPASFSHGEFTSALAVGESVGLAPSSQLRIAHFGYTTLDRMVGDVISHFQKILDLVQNDSSIKVIGMSFGQAVPKGLSSMVAGSASFLKLARLATALDAHGVRLVISSGNTGDVDASLINMFCLLPKVQIVGALSSHLTPAMTDDTRSRYTSDVPPGKRPALHAYADPVMGLGGARRVEWLARGGTSAAQPHVSGARLLLHQVNPQLGVDDVDMILDETSRLSAGRRHVRMLDPMRAMAAAAHLDGSTYTGERLLSLTEYLLDTTSTGFHHSSIMNSIRIRRSLDWDIFSSARREHPSRTKKANVL